MIVFVIKAKARNAYTHTHTHTHTQIAGLGKLNENGRWVFREDCIDVTSVSSLQIEGHFTYLHRHYQLFKKIHRRLFFSGIHAIFISSDPS